MDTKNFRKEIETFAIWYILVSTAASCLSWLIDKYLHGDLKELLPKDSQDFFFFKLQMLIAARDLLDFAGKIVIGVWLFIQTKNTGWRRILWFFFGAAGGLFAAVIHFGLRLFEPEQSMNIRKELETLAIWYLPVFALEACNSILLMPGHFPPFSMTAGDFVFRMEEFTLLLGQANKIVIAGWLLTRFQGEILRKALWAFIALTFSWYAVMLYVGLRAAAQRSKILQN